VCRRDGNPQGRRSSGAEAVIAGRVVMAGLLVVAAVLLQAGVVARLALPVRPDLVLLLVVAAARAGGPDAGAGYGFAAGLLLDLLGDHPAGVAALVLTAVGYSCGLSRRARPMLLRLAALVVVVSLASVAYPVGVAAVLAALRRPLDWPSIGASLPGQLAGNVIVAVLLGPAAVLRRR